jgi:hypothetical protein
VKSNTVAETMEKAAAAFAAKKATNEVVLDFSPDSLRHIDEMLSGMRPAYAVLTDDERQQLFGAFGVSCGAYLGEVMRRNAGGVWVKRDKEFPELILGMHSAFVIVAIVNLLMRGHVSLGDRDATSVVDYYESVMALSQSSTATALRGSHPTLDSLAAEMSHDAELAARLIKEAQAALRMVMANTGRSLDFSPASLDVVEEMLAQLHDKLEQAPEGQRPTKQQIEAAAVLFGVYVGEVVRRHYGGKWQLKQPERILQLDIGEAVVYPADKVLKRLLNGPSDAIPFYFCGIAVALER